MTFLAIIYTDLERGIAAGVIFSVFYFAFSYAKARGGDACDLRPPRQASAAMRLRQGVQNSLAVSRRRRVSLLQCVLLRHGAPR